MLDIEFILHNCVHNTQCKAHKIKMDLPLEERGLEGYGSACRREAGFCESVNEPSGSITRAEFLDQMRQF